MANQDLLINLTIFVFFAYITFLLTIQLTDTSTPTWSFGKFGRIVRGGYVTDNVTNLIRLPPSFTGTNLSLVPAMEIAVGHPEPGTRFKVSNDRKFVKFQSPVQPILSIRKNRTLIKRKSESGSIFDINAWTLDLQKNRSMSSQQTFTKSEFNVTESNCVKRILFWCDNTVRFDGDFYCEGSKCGMRVVRSVNVSDLADAEIVVFYHMIEKPWDELIRSRPPGQLWVFFSRESPRRCSACLPPKSHDNLFNISMTYLSDSDIIVPYGRFIPSKEPITRYLKMDLEQWSANKSKHILWVASNCARARWDRTGFVRHLTEYTDVDSYGRCGTLKCPREEKGHCQEVFMQYKFYLALENNLCRDYITEKVWRNSFQNDLVPIVFGANRVDFERALPPNSFIFAEDFNSTRELAEFIDEVGRNKTRYGEYFRWRELGTVSTWTRNLTFQPETFCRIVSKIINLQSGGSRNEPKKSIEAWWRSSCRAVNVLTDLKFADRGS